MSQVYILRRKAELPKVVSVALPASKSISNRLLILNALCEKPCQIENLSDSDDTKVMVEALKGDLKHIDIGAAGTAMRFLTAYLTLQPGVHEITGSERMRKRPIGTLVNALRAQGAQIEYMGEEGFPPLRITGATLKGGDVVFPGDISSQYITAFMLIAPVVPGGFTIKLTGTINSRPYIDMTMAILRKYGVDAHWCAEDTLVVPEGKLVSIPVNVEGDWTAVSYWYALAALCPETEFRLNPLDVDSTQGDSRTASFLEAFGLNGDLNNRVATLARKSAMTEYFKYDFRNQPDMAQTYVVLCCLLGIKFRFNGLESLKIKETDRISALVAELKKIGYVIQTNDKDEIWYEGERCEATYEPIKTYKDHRMAMAFAPAAMVLGHDLLIDEPSVVSKSYPNFWNDIAPLIDVIPQE
ncbi:MAG: 3-phosphoshikimate 1-carboxyvinyltransferase [Bacteroidia bacterium]|nr:3-phosphoshikimate 1-carboxyvinyltransferase [Bacteroidia bacterium]